MKHWILFAVAVVAAVLLAQPVLAQGWGLGPGPRGAWGGDPTAAQTQPPAPAALKEALGLTDQQMQQILDLRKQAAEANRSVVEQIRAKRQELANLMKAANPDAVKAGQLLVDIRKLEDQRRARLEEFRAKAVALLTADQKQKLADLEKALALGPAARQAVGLGLIVPPQGAPGLMGAPGRLAPIRGMRPGRPARMRGMGFAARAGAWI
ncbi:MAG: Spy/CpxP family protein refolding chaperone [Bryobacteraceae bacterium]|nr:Spy/CpxP family protein refolding chaperone [Bryobacteraceae bacterium]MCX7604662.1 Spy/CpxP family protein refolding chaperone [Bryobacteraceae bacterium]